MATAAATTGEHYVSIGRVLERSIGTIKHNPLVTLGIAFLFGGVPTLVMQWAVGLLAMPGVDAPGLAFAGVGLIMMVIGLIISSINQAALTKATIAEAEGRRAQFGETLSAALSVLLPLIGLSILFAVAVIIGFFFLIVPGIILYLMWAVAVPVLVEERLGIVESFGRSRELTRGARWKIFGLFLVLLVLYSMVSVAFGALSLGLAETPGGLTDRPAGIIIVEAVVATVTTVIWATVQASLYVELRNWKEGPASRNLEEVFS